MLKPGSPEWLRVITASKIPAILGVSRFQSQYTLWHEMAGNLDRQEITEQKQDLFDFGHASECAAREYWLLRNPGWKCSRGEVQFTEPALGFPNAATVDRRASRGRARKLLEVKAPRSLEDFGDDGSDDIPADHAAQMTWQMLVSGIHEAELVAWPAFGYPKVYPVAWNPVLAEAILGRVRAWVASLEAGTPPELDDTISCYEAVRALHPVIDGTEVQLDPDLAADYLQAVADDRETTTRLRGLKSRVLDVMGNAQHANCFDQKVASRRPGRGDSVSLYASKTDPTLIERLTA